MEALPLLLFNLVMKFCILRLLLVLSLTCFSSYCGACELFRCSDGRQFGYPFGSRNSGCGDPSLQLHCDNNNSMPLLDINGNKYYILDLNSSTLEYPSYYFTTFNILEGIVMTIIEENLLARKCDPSSSNSTTQFWSSDRLHIVEGYRNITLWEGCRDGTTSSPNEVFKLGCNASFYYSNSSDMSWTEKCKSQVQLPVRQYLDPGQNLVSNIKKGFEIKWMPSSSCEQCMSHAGICAYEANIASNPFFCDLSGYNSSIPVRGGKQKVRAIVGVTAGIGVMLIVPVLLLVAAVKLYVGKFSQKNTSSSSSKVEKFLQDFTHEMPIRYSYSQLKKITNNFAEKLGEGGFGVVYKGKLSMGNLVAVKILDQSRQSESQFMNEVATIGRIHHVNLVRLMGYCFEPFRSALVYEYMANGSLEKFVFLKKEETQILNWERLYSIALGAARGIAYLHEDCERRIIHFDIKPHNILLDEDFKPKVSDFGLAKLCVRLDDHVSLTTARGTPGYVAPELWSRNLGPITDKADVYSFGMLLLEIAGGRKNIDVQVSCSSEVYLPDWVFKLLERGELEQRLRGRVGDEIGCENDLEKLRMCKVGLWCIQYNSMDRPTMSRVVEMLEGNGDEVSNPPSPFNSSASPELRLMSCSEESSSV